MDPDRPFACDMCEKSFKRKHEVIRHKRIHTGEKPFKCDDCEKPFSDYSNLLRHKKKHNKTGEKPYECDVCEKTFSSNSNLYQHKKIHTGERPYECSICQKSYSQMAHLSKHNRSVAHLKKKAIMEVDYFYDPNNFAHCAETMQMNNIKEDIKEGEGVDNYLSIHQEAEISNVCGDIKEEIKEEENVDDSLTFNHFTESVVKQEIKEEGNVLDEGQGVEDSNLDTDHPVDCSQYVQVQMNLSQ